MSDEIVWHDENHLIIRSDRPFGTGFNVYRWEGDRAVKINDRLSWFKTLDAAKDWLDRH